MSQPDPYELEILSDERVAEGGFLHIRRLRLRNLHPDGSRSAPWVCDFVERRKGIDAVVVVLWRRLAGSAVEVLLRDGLRPALRLGRPADRVPMPEPPRPLLFTEVVAGIIEEGEVGEAAIRARAADEAWEEAGARIPHESIVLLGTSFPSPGLTSERFFFAAAELSGPLHPPEGDGSPMEEGARVRFVPLSTALAMCADGQIEDAKTEIILRRFADRLPTLLG
jgi:ADP-ribose pyrophosphatase